MAIRQYEQDGKTLFEVYVNGKDKLGRRVQFRRLAISSKKEAIKTEFELKRELARRREEIVSLNWEEWLEECISKMKLKFRPSTIESYDRCLKKWCSPAWDKKDISKITASDVHKVIFEGLDPKLTPSTKKFILKMIKRIFQMGVEEGLLVRNPALAIQLRVPEREQKVLNSEEVAKLLYEAKITDHRFYYIWAFALVTGMRSGEMYALKWSDLDLEAKLIRVSRNWTSKGGMGPTKSQKCRNVPISSGLEALLVGLRREAKDEFVLPHLPEWTRGEQARVLKDFCRSIGITEVKFHDLRATFITNLLMRGESLARVMSIVGHSDIDTTNVYLRKAGIEVQGATEKLGFKLPDVTEENVLSFQKASKRT